MGNERTPGEKGNGIGNHYENFINVIRTNDQKLAKGDIREAFYSCALVHSGNISYRLGRSLEFDPVKMKFINDAKADAMLSRHTGVHLLCRIMFIILFASNNNRSSSFKTFKYYLL